MVIASCGATSASPSLDNNSDNSQGAVAGPLDPGQLPEFPADDFAVAGAEGKSLSWISHPNHLAPFASHLGAVDPGDPNCFLLQGYAGGITGAPTKPQLAWAMYQLPLGATAADLLDLKVAAQVGAPGEQYYAAIGNFTALAWQFYGPFNAPDWHVDMTTIGYDFTGPAGNMYFVMVALPGEKLHITDITLNFKDREKPTYWNVYGRAFDDYLGVPIGGADVYFEDIFTSAIFSTTTAADGNWGMNLPTGKYNFWVFGCEMLLDVSGPIATIDYTPMGVGTRLDLDNTGKIIYQGGNAVYTGLEVPMPLITANWY